VFGDAAAAAVAGFGAVADLGLRAAGGDLHAG
jgi:hypothetical protein